MVGSTTGAAEFVFPIEAVAAVVDGGSHTVYGTGTIVTRHGG